LKLSDAMDSKESLKTVSLGTSKINYLDPRCGVGHVPSDINLTNPLPLSITVAWCKTHEVPIEKMYTKVLIAKFSWAMDTSPNFEW